jgi:hypothetical protein
MEHLFNNCHYSQTIWDLGSQLMRRSNRNKNNIKDTIENWDSLTYQNPILARIWQLLPGFTLWHIWKERNKRIFQSKASPPTSTWERIMKLIQETIKRRQWKTEDLKCSPGEWFILHNWHLSLADTPTSAVVTRRPSSPTTWTPPPIGFIKINFDGASKGNLGPSELRGSPQELKWRNPPPSSRISGLQHKQRS